ncbi:hypothetical protein H8959_008104 [Pygathrix nigripes]
MGVLFQVPIISSLKTKTVANYLPPDTQVCLADNRSLYAEAQMSNKDSDYGWYEEREGLETGASKGLLPVTEVQSYGFNWTEAPAAAVVGSETYGMSLDSL